MAYLLRSKSFFVIYSNNESMFVALTKTASASPTATRSVRIGETLSLNIPLNTNGDEFIYINQSSLAISTISGNTTALTKSPSKTEFNVALDLHSSKNGIITSGKQKVLINYSSGSSRATLTPSSLTINNTNGIGVILTKDTTLYLVLTSIDWTNITFPGDTSSSFTFAIGGIVVYRAR